MGSLWHIVSPDGAEIGAQTFQFFVEKHTNTGYPDPNNVLTPYGLADGARFQRTVQAARTFVLAGTLGTDNLRDWHMFRLMLINMVRRDRLATVQPVMVRYIALGKTLEIEAYFAGGLGVGDFSGFSEKMALRFTAPDPLFHEVDPVEVTLTVNGVTLVSNEGTADTFPIITLVGEGAVESLTNAATGQVITFDRLTIFPGETVTIDLRAGRKTVGSDVRGSLNYAVMQGSDISEWRLVVGENEIDLAAQAETYLVTEDGAFLTTEDETEFLVVSDTLDLTGHGLEFYKQHWSLDGVAA